MAANNEQENELSACAELVVVCCHATYTGTGRDGTIMNEDHWLLQPFQRADASRHKPSEVTTFLTHIIAGATLCCEPTALLMFSGGRTTSSERSEAESYTRVFEHLVSLGLLTGIGRRHAEEENATDSYQNLLFSILRFRTLTGRYPEFVTVVTHAFKERRFLELHARSVKWPPGRIRVLGVNPAFTLEEMQQTQQLEHERAYKPFAEDPYGTRPPLSDKRRARNWDPAVLECVAVEGSVRQLLAWNGSTNGREVFPGTLPWEET